MDFATAVECPVLSSLDFLPRFFYANFMSRHITITLSRFHFGYVLVTQ